MPYQPKRGWIERTAVRLGLLPKPRANNVLHELPVIGRLSRYPTADKWNEHIEFDPARYPREAVARRYRLAPTTCFNCESACGLLAYIDKDTNKIRKFEGNPLHPGSRGKNCAKGPATINQVNDPDRILYPMKRSGPRGGGQWQVVSWEEALADIGGRIRKALQENRHDEVVYHVGRPGAEGFMDRILRAWGVDGHNSHTNICSSGARLGYAIWSGYDRPSPDYANAGFIMALNAHLESGHYFNPHAQRISEGLSRGAKMAVMDPRLSNTAAMATYWLPTRPGSEAAVLLAFAHVLLREDLCDRKFVERWTNWRTYMRACEPNEPETIDAFFAALKRLYAGFTPEFAAAESGVPAEKIVTIAHHIGEAGSRFCSHTWRGSASGHLGGWQVARALQFLHALTGSVGTVGGTSPSAWNKYKAKIINMPPPQKQWNELHFPREFPLAHYEMSFLLPHFLKEGRGTIDVYFTRVFNPVWTYPDGFSWIEVLSDESKIGLHVALTPTWNETAFYADYVLPMGHGPERHDLNTYETHNATWIAFRQPVLRAAAQAEGRDIKDTREVNPGQVWEEDEFWMALSRAIDPDGAMGIRKYFDSPNRPGEPLGVDDYYGHAFDHVPGLPETARAAGLTPLEYMRKVGAYEVQKKVYLRHERRLTPEELDGAEIDPQTGVIRKAGAAIGVMLPARDGEAPAGPGSPRIAVEGFATPSRLLEFYSPTLIEWGWPEYAVPGYIASHVYERHEGARHPPPAAAGELWVNSGQAAARRHEGNREGIPDTGGARRDSRTSGESGGAERNPQSEVRNPQSMCLLPTFRLPTLIHTRSGSAKWLNEISQRNPVWIHPSDAARLGVRTGDLVRVNTAIGYFVDKLWVTEGMRPGVIACSHHLGRWRRRHDPPNSRWSGSVVSIECEGTQARRHGATKDSVLSPQSSVLAADSALSTQDSGLTWRLRILHGPQPFDSPDPDSRRLWWRDGGVPQNLTFPVQPDPISGMHCWHQAVTVDRASADDRAGDVVVDTNKSMAVYREWMQRTRPASPGPNGLRRPLWLARPLRPAEEAFRF